MTAVPSSRVPIAFRNPFLVALVLLALLPAPTAGAGEPPLQALARATVGSGQGVYVLAEDGTVLAAEAADRAVHPASVTKIATALALLQRLGPEHRFETRVAATGTIADGALAGDLVVTASGDPFLVPEGAFLILRRLSDLGVHIVEGRLRVEGPLLFNWERDPDGAAFARALAGQVGADAWQATAPAGSRLTLRDAALTFRRHDGRRSPTRTVLVYRSPPLLAILKALDGYSNNVLHFASDVIGGPASVAAIARASVPADLRGEITIANAAGAGTVNRISPRAAVALLDALAHELAGYGKTLTDVLPVSGIDPGTLRQRLLEPPAGPGIVVGKTGTYGSEGASALAGALRTRRFGTVRFAVLNSGIPVPEARRRQDAFVGKLAAATDAEPWPYHGAAAPAFLAAEVH